MSFYPVIVFALTMAIVSVAGCTSSPFESAWPIPSKEIIELKPPALGSAPDRQLNEAVNYGNALLKLINAHYDKKNRMDWANGDFTTFGALGALAGVVSGQPGLMNSGAGISAVGATASTRYQYASQRTIYEEARKATECVLQVAGRTNDNAVIWAANQTASPEASTVAVSFPDDVLRAFTTIQSRLVNRLSTLQNQSLNTGDLQKYFDAQTKSEIIQGKARQGLINRQQQVYLLKQNINTAKSGRGVEAEEHMAMQNQDQLQKQADLFRYELEASRIPKDRQQEYLAKLISAGPDLIACYAGF
ncbi:MAG: hypothetical protein PGN19_13775 [Pseudomonas oryzihabitans]